MRMWSRSSMLWSAIFNQLPKQSIHPVNPNILTFYRCAGLGLTQTHGVDGPRNTFAVYPSYPGMSLDHLAFLTRHRSLEGSISSPISSGAGQIPDSLPQSCILQMEVMKTGTV